MIERTYPERQRHTGDPLLRPRSRREPLRRERHFSRAFEMPSALRPPGDMVVRARVVGLERPPGEEGAPLPVVVDMVVRLAVAPEADVRPVSEGPLALTCAI